LLMCHEAQGCIAIVQKYSGLLLHLMLTFNMTFALFQAQIRNSNACLSFQNIDHHSVGSGGYLMLCLLCL
jgi:hypothetical protein